MVCSSSSTRLNPYCLWSQLSIQAPSFFVSNLPLGSSYVPNTVRIYSIRESPISAASKVKKYNLSPFVPIGLPADLLLPFWASC